MKKIIFLLIILLFVLGCQQIPECDDKNHCTSDSYNATLKECVYRTITPCDGNGICEQGEYKISDDCPDCGDAVCTNTYYDYSNEKCVVEKIPYCCGNYLCEEDEDYMTCFQDCKAPMAVGNLSSKPSMIEHYEIEGNVFRADSRVLGKYDVEAWLDDFELDSLVIWQYINFREDAEDFELEFECHDQDGLRMRARGDFGYNLFEKDSVPYILLDQALFACGDLCWGEEWPENRILAKKILKNGTGVVKIFFGVNDDYNIELYCEGMLRSNKPEQTVNFNFKVEYQ